MGPEGRWEWNLAREVTQYVSATPGGTGPTVYRDDDGTVDVNVPDRYGRPWYMYRAHEGELKVLDAAYAATLADTSVVARPEQDVDSLRQKLRNTGQLERMGLPQGAFSQFPDVTLVMIEPDVLMGRRGVLGWDGQEYSWGLVVPTLRWHERVVKAVINWWEDLPALVRVALGVVAVVIAAVLTIVTGGCDLGGGGAGLELADREHVAALCCSCDGPVHPGHSLGDGARSRDGFVPGSTTSTYERLAERSVCQPAAGTSRLWPYGLTLCR